jgi:hypothetical protein
MIKKRWEMVVSMRTTSQVIALAFREQGDRVLRLIFHVATLKGFLWLFLMVSF